MLDDRISAHKATIYPPDLPTSSPRRKRIIVAITGATGAILGIKILLALRQLNVETHLVISKWGEATIKYETDYNSSNIRHLVDHAYQNSDLAAAISSGSFRADGMIQGWDQPTRPSRKGPLLLRATYWAIIIVSSFLIRK